MSGDARVAFLTGLIDDAGLFPPASLSMEDAVAAHRASRGGENGWMVARFICPASRLPALAKWLPEDDPAGPWRVSVILDGAPGERWLEGAVADLTEARSFADEAGSKARVEFVEVPLPGPLDPNLLRPFVARLRDSGLRDPVTPFLEVPGAAALPATLETIAGVHDQMPSDGAGRPLGAKLRCGGATEDLFPTPARVASFIDECRNLRIAFKATAGLHHPFRHADSETGFVQHGFLNLVGAAVLESAHNLGAAALEAIIADEDPASFSLTNDRFSWQDLHASEAEIREARSNLFTAYGSCSFAEPVDDLTALAILPIT